MHEGRRRGWGAWTPALLAGALAACAPQTIAVSPTPLDHALVVTGTATLDVVPDEACVELGLTARDPSMPAAHAALMASEGALLADLRARPGLVVEQGAPAYSPEYDSDGSGRSHLARYVATAQVDVRVRDFTLIPDVVGRAAPRGLERVNVVYYSTQIVARKAEVRTRALEAAAAKARAMAATLGASLGEVLNVAEGDVRTNASVTTNNYLDRGNADRGSDQPAPPSSIPLSVSVTVAYRVR